MNPHRARSGRSWSSSGAKMLRKLPPWKFNMGRPRASSNHPDFQGASCSTSGGVSNPPKLHFLLKLHFKPFVLQRNLNRKHHTLENLDQTFRYIRKGRVLKLWRISKKKKLQPPPPCGSFLAGHFSPLQQVIPIGELI